MGASCPGPSAASAANRMARRHAPAEAVQEARSATSPASRLICDGLTKGPSADLAARACGCAGRGQVFWRQGKDAGPGNVNAAQACTCLKGGANPAFPAYRCQGLRIGRDNRNNRLARSRGALRGVSCEGRIGNRTSLLYGRLPSAIIGVVVWCGPPGGPDVVIERVCPGGRKQEYRSIQEPGVRQSGHRVVAGRWLHFYNAWAILLFRPAQGPSCRKGGMRRVYRHETV